MYDSIKRLLRMSYFNPIENICSLHLCQDVSGLDKLSNVYTTVSDKNKAFTKVSRKQSEHS